MNVIVDLKLKAIEEYDSLIKKLELGHNPNYSNIINIINYLDAKLNNNYIASSLLNGKQ